MATTTTSSSLDSHALRRTQSAGNIEPSRAVQLPRGLSASPRLSEGHGSRIESATGLVDNPAGPSQRITIPGRAHTVGEDLRNVHHPDPFAFEDMHDTTLPGELPDSGVHSWADRALRLLGYSGADARARRELLSLIWDLSFGLAQFVIVVTLLAYSAHTESPTKPGLTEWQACARPLGVWNSLWLIRVALGCLLATWSYMRSRTARRLMERRRALHAESGRLEDLIPRAPSFNVTSRPPNSAQAGASNERNPDDIDANSKWPHLYARLSLLTSFLSLAWFLTAHILEYTSVTTCRYSSPHLWWLTFGILCILYLMILEIFLLGLLVFFVGPVLYLFWNLVLLCLGRHPLQNPHLIRPEIGKLPRAIVDQIPLVLYIPPPPDAADEGFKTPTVPDPAHTYPPTKQTEKPRRRRFAFLRRSKKSDSEGKDSLSPIGPDGKGELPLTDAWEERWEPSEYPFVRLEGNRAACAICLLDFEEPKRVGAADDGEEPAKDAEEQEDPVEEQAAPAQELQVEEVTQEERETLRLDDAGEGAQPLRLLSCGHVFHKTCVDPWLTDVSGRCPVCQRPVEIAPSAGKKKSRRRRT